MKKLALTTALILGVSAPAFAQSQLEKDLGVAPGVYSAAQIVALKSAAEQTGNDATVYFGDKSVAVMSSSNIANARAHSIAQSIAKASDDGNERLFAANVGKSPVGHGAINATAAAIFADIAAASDEKS